MAETDKPKWPKTPDGTTDWETVFENADNGLIPLVMKADNPLALGKSTYTLIQRLFTRKSDEQNAADLLARLEIIIVDSSKAADLDIKKEQVAKLLRGIKEERIKKAEEHLRRKARGDAIERRGRSRRFKKRLLMAGAMAVLLTLTAGLGAVLAAFFLDDSRVTTITADFDPNARPLPAPEPESNAEVPSTEESPTTEEPAPTPPPVKRYVLLNTVRWTFSPDGKKPRTMFFSPMIELADMNDYPDICSHLPSLLDTVNQTMSTVFKRSAQPGSVELANANLHATELINRALGETVVLSFSFSQDIEGRARINTRQPCRLYPPLEKPEP